MGIQYSDSLGAVVDTGCNTRPTARPSVEVEVHSSLEVETGSKLATTAVAATHIPHRPVGHPR